MMLARMFILFGTWAEGQILGVMSVTYRSTVTISLIAAATVPRYAVGVRADRQPVRPDHRRAPCQEQRDIQ